MLSVLRLTNRCIKTDFKLNSNNWQLIRNFGKRNVDKNDRNINKSLVLNNIKSLIKPFIFTFGFSATVYSVYLVYNFENSIYLKQKFNNWIQWKQTFNTIPSYNENNNKSSNILDKLTEWWKTTNNSFKLFLGIAAINVMIFICWRVPRFQPFMAKHFMTSDTINKELKCWPMLWSTFSHYSATHLTFNLVVLYSFSQIGGQLFGWDQLLAFYLSAGVISSFGGYLAKVVTARTGPSLGASGAILAVLSSCCIARPDLELMIIFLPFFTIPAGLALKGIILMDSAGLVLGWRFFDHGAHLAGTLFGIWYTTYGQNIVSKNKGKVINIWEKIRNKII